MWEDVKCLLAVFLSVEVVFLAVTGLIVLLGTSLASRSCTASAGKMGLEHSYSLMTDCMVKVDGRWEPLSWQRSIRIKE